MNKEERFILVRVFEDNSIMTIIGSFDKICNDIEYELTKIENNDKRFFQVKNMVVYDRKESTSDMDLNCNYTIYDETIKKYPRINYSEFVDSYYGAEDL